MPIMNNRQAEWFAFLQSAPAQHWQDYHAALMVIDSDYRTAFAAWCVTP